jgi:hypothetical protein
MSLILDGTSGLSDVDGSAATPAIRGTDTNTGIFFPAADTIAFSEGGTEAMRINSSGNLVPGADSTYSLGASGSRWLTINASTFSEGGATNNFITTSSTTTLFNSGSTWQQAAFYSAGSERMRIDSSGNLLVGATSPSFSTANGIYLSPQGRVLGTCTNDSSGAFSRLGSDGAAVAFYRSTTLVGTISVTASATAYNTSSDYRLKENIAPMTGALATVSQLKPVTYKWKSTGEDSQGFIAHELQAVVPDCVTGEKDAVDEQGKPIYQGIDTSFLVATLTAAIQEQQALITDLTTRLTALETA